MHRFMRSALVVATLALAIALVTPAFAHNGMRDTGSTLRQLGRGGTYIATPPDAGSLNGNPAALALLEGPEGFFDLRLFQSSVEYDGLLNARSQDKQLWVPNAAFAAPLGDKFGWGVGVFSVTHQAYGLQGFDLSRIGLPTGTTDSSSSGVRYLAVTPGFAMRLNDRTAIGASVNWSSGTSEDQTYSIMGNTVGHRLSNLSGKGYALRAGVYHQLDDCTTIGAVWKSRSHLKASGGTLVTGPMYTTPSATITGVEVQGGDFPEEYGIGIGRELSPQWSVYGEWRRLKWAKVRQTISVVPPVGSPLLFPMNWRDQDVYALGAEYRPHGDNARLWRAGVNYGASPVPDNTLGAIFPTTNELHLSAGYERQLSSKWRLITGANYAFAHQQTSTADNPNNALYGAGQPFSVGSSNLELGIGLSWAVGRKPQPQAEESCDCMLNELAVEEQSAEEAAE